MNKQEACNLLELTIPFTAEQAKVAYRKKAIIAHPDKGGSTEKMKEINDAYRICSKGIEFCYVPEINFNGVDFNGVHFKFHPPKKKVLRVCKKEGEYQIYFKDKFLGTAIFANKAYGFKTRGSIILSSNMLVEISNTLRQLVANERK